MITESNRDQPVWKPEERSRPEIAEEIKFFTHRLEVLERWPESKHRSTVMAATSERLLKLGDVAPMLQQ